MSLKPQTATGSEIRASPAGKGQPGKSPASKGLSSPEVKAQRASSAGANKAATKSYSAKEDLKIYELFKEKVFDKKHDNWFNNQKQILATTLKRSLESMRDRYKKYLRFLSEDDVQRIKESSSGDPDHYFIHFDKIGSIKKFKECLAEEPRQVIGKKQPPKPEGEKKVRVKRAPSTGGRKNKTSFPNALTGKRKYIRGQSGQDEAATYQGQRKVIVTQHHFSDDDWEQVFDIRDCVADDYFSAENYYSLNEIEPSVTCKQDLKAVTEYMAGIVDVISVNFDGNGFEFAFVKRPAQKELNKVLGSVVQLLGVSQDEAERIFEQLSHDLDDLKAYIGGKKKLLWTSVDDLALKNALQDKNSFERFYPHLVKEKGEDSVKKRVEYLRHKKK